MLYGALRQTAAVLARTLCRPTIQGRDNVPATGPVILAGNHLSFVDSVVIPLSVTHRRVRFLAKSDYFETPGVKGRLTKTMFGALGAMPVRRGNARDAMMSLEMMLDRLNDGEACVVYPEGTRSPDGRLYKGKTGVARLVLANDVPVIPVAMVNTEIVRNRFGIPYMKRPGVRIGQPLDFSAWSAQNGQREVLRWVTDEIMNAVMELSGQEYVDAYGASVKSAAAEGRELAQPVLPRPGYGHPRPPMPPEAQGIELEAS